MYMVFNAILYGGQVALYAVLFLSTDPTFLGVNLRNLLFVIVTGINFTAVAMTWALYFYLGFKFSGFPFRTDRAKKDFRKISQVIFYWSLSRLVWGGAMLASYTNDIGWVSDTDNSLAR